MNERSMRESPVESGLEGARGRRKKLMEKLVDSPWKWALMAVMALENQGCAELPRQFGWLGLEPQKGATMEWDVGYRGQSTQEIQPGSEREAATVQGSRGPGREQVAYTGPRAYLEFGPPVARPDIDHLPEGFDGSNPDSIFAVAHGQPRNRRMAVTVDDPRLLRFGQPLVVQEDVEAQKRMKAQPGVSDEERLKDVMRTTIKPLDIYIEREEVAARAVKMLLPKMSDRRWGVRLEWQEVQRPEQGQTPKLIISCRTSPWAAPAVESASNKPVTGHSLEHDVLSNNQAVWANLGGKELYFSPEKSGRFPLRPAQAAFVSKPIVLEQWNQAQALLAESKRQLAALPKSEVSMSPPEIVRHRAKKAELQSEITRLTNLIDTSFNNARLSGIGETLVKFIPLIHDNELRFYIRFDEAHETLRIIAVLDDPDTSKL
ncbi:MAG: hypothetical protein WC551_00505 [Patescibacteria group bacterium]